MSATRSNEAAVLVPGLEHGGGVPRVADFVGWNLKRLGYSVTLISLATSRADSHSTTLTRPSSLFRAPLVTDVTINDLTYLHAGSRLREVELLRYAPRHELTERLKEFDIVQMVAGFPAWAMVLSGARQRAFLQVATTVALERATERPRFSLLSRPYRTLSNALASRLDRRAVSVPAHVFTENSHMQDWVSRNRRGETSVSLVPPGIDTNYFLPRGPWRPDGPLISVGRLGDPRKGWARLIEAYAEARRVMKVPPLLLVGSGQLESHVDKQIVELSLSDAVHVESDVTDDALLTLLQASSLFVQTSYEEGLGIAALEAMSCGLPVVATDTYGARQYVRDGVTGFRLPQGHGLAGSFGRSVAIVLGGDGPTMSLHARRLVEQTYDRFVCGDQFATTYARAADHE